MHIFLYIILPIIICILLIIIAFIIGIGVGITYTKHQLLDSMKTEFDKTRTINGIIKAVSNNDINEIKLGRY